MDRVLLLTCYAGGGVFGPQFDRIGIATKMIRQAVADAGAKGYRARRGLCPPGGGAHASKLRLHLRGVGKRPGRAAKILYAGDSKYINNEIKWSVIASI